MKGYRYIIEATEKEVKNITKKISLNAFLAGEVKNLNKDLKFTTNVREGRRTEIKRHGLLGVLRTLGFLSTVTTRGNGDLELIYSDILCGEELEFNLENIKKGIIFENHFQEIIQDFKNDLENEIEDAIDLKYSLEDLDDFLSFAKKVFEKQPKI